MIYHIAREDDWQSGLMAEQYLPAEFAADGFIHCSTHEQVLRVANRFYRGQSDLVLLEIDPERVEAEVIYENLEGGEERFPHLYGPLNLDAVAAVHVFTPGGNGSFQLPAGLDG
ncbi:MAG: DUF952 domain-containing protein [Anaerolineae bacterium]|nr:DUF952 domain-containing protein [Anaerolineae bacterium]